MSRYPRLVSEDGVTISEGTSDDGGSPPGGGNMEARVAKLESDVGHVLTSVKHLRDDVRDVRTDLRFDVWAILGAGGGACLLLLWVMAKGFGWV